MEITKAREKLSEQDIHTFEVELGTTLPEDYQQFLLSHNGGRPHPDGFMIHTLATYERDQIHFFFCIKDRDIYDLRTILKRYCDRIPANLLAIANDHGGNLICISIKGNDIGKVYFWNHEEESTENQPPNYKNIDFVANSFQELLDNLIEF